MIMTITGSTPISIRAWLKDLTYQESHAFTWGYGLVLTGIATQTPVLLSIALGLLVYAWTEKKVKKKDIDFENIPAYVKRQIKRELQYYLGGMFAGGISGGVLHYLGLTVNLTPILPL